MSLADSYFNYLVSLTNCHDRWALEFQRIIFGIEFIFDNDMDENCYCNGLMMRRVFADECGLNWVRTRNGLKEEIGRTCNVLEMIVGLAWRMDHDIMYNPDFGERIDVWCKSMFENLGLFDADIKDVESIIDDWLHKRYAKNGDGGLFNLKHPGRKDMRKAHIWMQMNWWLNENYSEEFL